MLSLPRSCNEKSNRKDEKNGENGENSTGCREIHGILPWQQDFPILSERNDAKSAPTIDNAEKTLEILLAMVLNSSKKFGNDERWP